MSKINKKQAKDILRDSLGDISAEFRDGQWEAISALVNNKEKLLVVQRTGWGKSAVYFIATRLLREQGRGVTIIISPLLALMRNQIESADRYGVSLCTLNSSLSREERERTILGILSGKFDAIIIAPEQLAKPSVIEKVLMPIADNAGLFVIDEAHCISDWGHDFRPDYKRIVNILPFMPSNMPILATTATANQRVVEDVSLQLGSNIQVFRGSLVRGTVHLQILDLSKSSERLAWLSDNIETIDGTGIIYTSTKDSAELLSRWMNHRGIKSCFYHSKVPKADRLQIESELLNNQTKVVVSTSALGMGYDKPDLSFVIHYQSPGSAIAYYQQVGRAGRGITRAHGVLMSGPEDAKIQESFIKNAFPKPKIVKSMLDVVTQSDDGLTMNQIKNATNSPPKKVEAALRFLCAESPAPIVVIQQEKVKYSRTALDYDFPHEQVQLLSGVKQQEWKRMQEYTQHSGCLMQFLSNELDDYSTEDCGKCENCNPSQVMSSNYKKETQDAAISFLKNVFIEIPPRIKIPKNHFPIFQFPNDLRKNKKEPNLVFQTGRALCRWGEGWGEVAMEGKRNKSFDSRLVKASAEMIQERWGLKPAWLTCVPSHNSPDLVPNFARDLSEELNIAFHDVVRKVSRNKSQKAMETTKFRCANLDGVFDIVGDLPTGPVLLVDDAMDSRWTFTVISALLRRAGSDDVYPFAIMDTSTRF